MIVVHFLDFVSIANVIGKNVRYESTEIELIVVNVRHGILLRDKVKYC